MEKINVIGIPSASQRMILWVFLLYSTVIVGMGWYVKRTSKSEFAEFLTGGGSLGTLEVTMIAAMTSMAGGTMISAPGYAYLYGFAYSLIALMYSMNNFISLGTFGKKFAILRRRIDAQTILQLLHHRFQSRRVVITATAITILFLTVNAGGQFLNAARIFSVVMGTDTYVAGLVLAVVVVLVYTMTGGVKSLSRICVVQGMFMILAVSFMVAALHLTVAGLHGGHTEALAFMARNNEALLQVRTYAWQEALGLAVVAGWANTFNPAILQVSMMYDNTKVMNRSMVSGCVIAFAVYGIMTTSGVFTYTLWQNIGNADNATIYLAASLLPGWMAGIVFSAIFASIQSSVSAFLLQIAGSLTRDIYKDCINPGADDKKLQRMNLVLFGLFGVVSALLALNPSRLAQELLILAAGGTAMGVAVPLLFGTYWKKATADGAFASCVGGTGVFILHTLLRQAGPLQEVAGSVHPILLATAVSVLLMLVVSLATQSRRVPFGIYRVWFCRDYDERYAEIYHSCDHFHSCRK